MDDEEARLEALKQVADKETVKSIRQTLLVCILLRVFRGPGPRWRSKITISIGAALAYGLMHWHLIISLFR